MKKIEKEYLERLRADMANEGVDAVIVSGTDPHQSENPPACWRDREWLTGFKSVNGTNGTAVVTPTQALCWTDTRYFLQAQEQLQGTGFEMMEEDGPGAVNLVEWVATHLPAGSRVAIDGSTFSITYAARIEATLKEKGLVLVTDYTPFSRINKERPARPLNKLFVHDEAIVCETVDSKVSRTMAEVKKEKADSVILSSLDDIAWVTNLRTARDIAFSPIFVSYLYLSSDSRILFVDAEKLESEPVKAHLAKYHITTRPYEEVMQFASQLPADEKVLIDPDKSSRMLLDNLSGTPIYGGAGVAKLKSIKNAGMLRSLDKAMEKDGVALVKFFKSIDEEVGQGALTEVNLGERLRALRLSDPTCVDESFAPIIGFNGHGAIVHYEATEQSDVPVVGNGVLLVDTGGQYTLGTTDITRTVAIGEVSEEVRHDFTLVLKGHIALSMVEFPEGTTGHQVDILARQFLWKEGKAYYHGTGHGVGFFINCHEGPQSVRLNHNPVALEEGMIISNEPGLYLADRYGIRCENLVVVEQSQTTDFGKFLRLRTVTLFPFDSKLIEVESLNDQELEWLNSYHAEVRARLTPLLSPEEAQWLKEKTEPIKK